MIIGKMDLKKLCLLLFFLLGFSVLAQEEGLILLTRREDNLTTAFLLNPGTGEETPLSEFVGLGDLGWSPDGRYITFHSERDGNSEVYIMGSHGENQRSLTNSPALDRAPRFSTDGSEILFRSERNGDSELFIMNLDGSNVRQITNNDARDMHPDW